VDVAAGSSVKAVGAALGAIAAVSGVAALATAVAELAAVALAAAVGGAAGGLAAVVGCGAGAVGVASCANHHTMPPASAALMIAINVAGSSRLVLGPLRSMGLAIPRGIGGGAGSRAGGSISFAPSSESACGGSGERSRTAPPVESVEGL
jgi:hypothetical protein